MRRHLLIFATILTIGLGSVVALQGVSAGDEFGLHTVSSRAQLQRFGGSVPTAIGSLLGGALALVGILFFILTIYGGILWMTSHGNKDQAMKGLKAIISAIIGLLIVLASYVIVQFVFRSVEGAPSTPASPNAPQQTIRECTDANFPGFNCAPNNACASGVTIGADRASCSTEGHVCCQRRTPITCVNKSNPPASANCQAINCAAESSPLGGCTRSNSVAACCDPT